MVEEVIIDGVNVSECDRYIANDGYMGVYKTPVFKGDCKLSHIGKCQGSECLFKRFKYKEQECEELKKGNEKLKIQLMQKSEVNTFSNTAIEGWYNNACKICQYKQDYQAKEQECKHWKNQCLCLDGEDVTVQITQQQFEEYRKLKKQLKNELDWHKQADKVDTVNHIYTEKLKQALEEIEKYQKRNCETCVYANTQKCNINCQAFVIFDIINKAKDGK